MKYQTIDALSDDIREKKENAGNLTLFLDGGEAIINNLEGETVFRDYERTLLIALVWLCLGIEHEEI